MATLYIVATPIGNLKDISFRAIETLKEVDLILAEDTRITKKILSHYNIHTPIKSYHKYSTEKVCEFAAENLKKGKNIALTTDAGTPTISDPGSKLVAYIKKTLPEAKISPIPGPSALISALSAAGIGADSFTFLGYPPHKKGRQKFFKNLEKVLKPVVFYESPHRLEKALEQLKETVGDGEIIVAKELTKIHEEIWRGKIEEAQIYFIKEKKKGEFTIIIP
tara:strand:- start:70 stop:735 length:666 start_codon:yes stop_codon:yes gene_type:complete